MRKLTHDHAMLTAVSAASTVNVSGSWDDDVAQNAVDVRPGNVEPDDPKQRPCAEKVFGKSTPSIR